MRCPTCKQTLPAYPNGMFVCRCGRCSLVYVDAWYTCVSVRLMTPDEYAKEWHVVDAFRDGSDG